MTDTQGPVQAGPEGTDMQTETKGFDADYLLDLIFDVLDLINTIIEVLRNFGEFLSGN